MLLNFFKMVSLHYALSTFLYADVPQHPSHQLRIARVDSLPNDVQTSMKLYNNGHQPRQRSRYCDSVTCYSTGKSSLNSSHRQEHSLLQNVQTSSLPNQPLIQWVPSVLFLSVKRPQREAGHSPPTTAEKTYDYMHRDNSKCALFTLHSTKCLVSDKCKSKIDFSINRTILSADYADSVQLVCLHFLFYYFTYTVLQTTDCITTYSQYPLFLTFRP